MTPASAEECNLAATRPHTADANLQVICTRGAKALFAGTRAD